MTRQSRTVSRPKDIVARDVRAARDRLLAATRRHPRLTDAGVAAVVLAVSVPQVITPGGVEVLALALIAAEAAVLVGRRVEPFGAFLIISVLVLVQTVTTGDLGIAILVAFYTVAAYETPRGVLLAAAMLEAGAALLSFGANVKVSLQVWVFLSVSGTFAVAGFLGYYARTRRASFESLVDRAARLERERGQQAQLAAAAERARIAREVHDIVAHNIAVMIALADGAAYTAEAHPDQAVSIMGQVSATGRSALGEMRRLLGVLREPAAPGPAPQPTLDDVGDLIAGVRSAGLPTQLTVTGEPFPLPLSAQLALYRTIQEALTNTLKHAPGATAEVRLAYQPGEVELEVTDDGRPAAVPAAGTQGSGHGIAGMRERAALFGGQVSAGPRPGGGWRVHTVLHPCPATEDA